ILKRLVLMIPTVIGAAVVIFFLLRLMPGDVCEMKIGADGGIYDPQAVALCQKNLGLDRPTLVQFGDFLWGIATFDYGNSMWTGRPIIHEIGLRFELSLQIALMATFVAVVLAIPFGTLSAVYQNTWIDFLV